MLFVFRKLSQRSVWRQVLVERLSEPLHLNIISLFVALFGSLRMKIFYDLLVRQNHAFGLLQAADEARRMGLRRVTAMEFGVANGGGLLNMCEVGRRISRLTGIEFDFVGFDNVSGMPPYRDYRDHPEMYQPGWYRMEDPTALQGRLPSNAKLLLGDISKTVNDFMEEHQENSPIGFISIDVDYYWSAAEALKCLSREAPHYLPLVTMYFDDVGNPGHNRWCGELLAIDEFNAANSLRKISPINFLRERRLFKNASWLGKMRYCHIFDHLDRLNALKAYGQVDLGNPYLNLKSRRQPLGADGKR